MYISVLIVVLLICIICGLQQTQQTASASEVGISHATNLKNVSLENNESVVLIPNSNYFICNPLHHVNDGSDNPKGTCTTVAIQMLLGYHNYYTDRRLIPETFDDKRFLCENYGDLNYYPDVKPDTAHGYGLNKIGTEDLVYEEIFNLTTWAEDPNIGQNFLFVKNGTKRFLDEYSPISDAVNINFGLYSSEFVKDEIASGNPVVLGMMGKNDKGNASFHVVVAYGFATIDGEFGYICHWTWGDSNVMMWAPESWFVFQETIEIDHTHNFIQGTENIKDSHRDFTCETCNCKLAKSIYQLNKEGNEITGLNYNPGENFTIPSQINNKQITSIGSNVFAHNPAIKKVEIPSSIENIGNNAFDNCLNLETIDFTYGIESIGEFAFRNCVSLNKILLPSSLTDLEIGAFSGCNNLNIVVSSYNQNYVSDENILYNKDQTKILASGKISSTIYIPGDVDEIMSSAFESNTNLQEVHFPRSNPIINSHSFANCSNLQSVYFYDYNNLTLASDGFAYTECVAYVPYNSKDIYSQAFANSLVYVTSIDTQLLFASDGTVVDSQNICFGSTLDGLPHITKKGYDFIGWYDNENFYGEPWNEGRLLEETTNKTLYAKWNPKQFLITFTGEHTEDIADKTVVYDEPIGTLPLVEKRGYTFLGWKNSDNLYFYEDTLWQWEQDIELVSDWQANEYTIHYDGNGGTATVDSQSVIFEELIMSLSDCQRNGYSFIGWNTAVDGSGEDIVAPIIYTYDVDITLYAQWQAVEYNIYYNLDGGTQSAQNPETYTIDSGAIFAAPTKKGYTFIGWKIDGISVTGIELGTYGDVVVDAFWDANKYTITLDVNGGTPEIETFEVFYDDDYIVATIPSKMGSVFEGWYDTREVGGTQYTDATGKSINSWNKTSDMTLYARWSAKKYEIQINDNGSITWLGPNGFSDESCTIEYGTVVNSINLIAIFKQSSAGYKDGRIFDHFEYDNEKLDWTSIPDLGTNGSVITVIPVWVPEKHTIHFNTLCEIVVPDIEALYDKDIMSNGENTLPSVDRNGYVFLGWFTSATGGNKVDWKIMPDLTPNEQGNGSIVLFARYDYKSYDINYELDGGTNNENNPNKYRIDSTIKLYDPIKKGYVFKGWYLDANKTIQVNLSNFGTGNKTLYAKWSPITYYIQYEPNGGTGSMTNSAHVYDESKQLNANKFTRKGYGFVGWALSSTGSSVYSDGQQVKNVPNCEEVSIVHLYAVWGANIYKVKYNANGGTGSMSTSGFVYDKAQNLRANTFTRTGYTFAGWSRTSTSNVVEFVDKASVINLTDIYNGMVNLYAVWTPKKYTVTLDKQGGTGGTSSITATYDKKLETANAPQKTGYDFKGYYSGEKGQGKKYYDENMYCNITWTDESLLKLYAYWVPHVYSITYNLNGGRNHSRNPATYTIESNTITFYDAFKDGYKCTWDVTVIPKGSTGNRTINASWSPISYRVYAYYVNEEKWEVIEKIQDVFEMKYEQTASVTARQFKGYEFKYWKYYPSIVSSPDNKDLYPIYSYDTTISFKNLSYREGYNYDMVACYEQKSCVTTGTFITLADGTQVPVELLKGDEMLLVWNMLTGEYDASKILFIDSDPTQIYKVINLGFSDGTTVKVISEHGFWNYDLNKYVYLDSNASQYIGHWFNKGDTRVQLTSVDIRDEYTTAYSPVTEGHLCYFVNGMLSMPGGIEGLFNIFEVDADTMIINLNAMAQDIETYGLFTYEEFVEMLPIPESVFNAFNGQYLKVAIGKGMITIEQLQKLVARYAVYFESIS